MGNSKNDWRKMTPPMIPVYFIDIDFLEDLLEKRDSISMVGLDLMLGYFEEFEMYEKAALVRDAINEKTEGVHTIESYVEDYVDRDDDEDDEEDPFSVYNLKNPFK